MEPVSTMAGQDFGKLKASHGVTLLGGGEIKSWAMSRWGEAVRAGGACKCPGTTGKNAAMMSKGLAQTDWAMAVFMVLQLEQNSSSDRNSASSPGI